MALNIGKKRWIALLGILLFAFILYQFDWREIARILERANPVLLLLAVAVSSLTVLGKGSKWVQVLQSNGINIPITTASKAFSVGFFLGVLTPSRVGDFSRAWYVRDKMPLGSAISTVLIDRLLDVFTLFLMAMFSLSLFSVLFHQTIISIGWVALLFLAFSAAIVLLLRKRNAERLAKRLFQWVLPESWKGRAKKSFQDFFESIQKAKQNRKHVLYAFLIGIVNWGLSYATAFLVASSLSLPLGFFSIVLAIPIVSLVELLPVTILGFGTREATLVFLFSFFGLAAAESVAFSIAYVATNHLVVAAIGLVFFIQHPIHPKLD